MIMKYHLCFFFLFLANATCMCQCVCVIGDCVGTVVGQWQVLKLDCLCMDPLDLFSMLLQCVYTINSVVNMRLCAHCSLFFSLFIKKKDFLQ